MARPGQTVKLKYGDEDAKLINEIKSLIGVEKRSDDIRIALRAFHRDYVFEGKAFKPIRNEAIERSTFEEDKTG